MKKVIYLVLVLALALSVMGMAPAAAQKTSELTVINKSGHVLQIKMVGKEYGKVLYVSVPEGSRAFPVEQKWSLWRDTYTVYVWYASKVDSRGIVSELTPCVLGIDQDLGDYDLYRIKADKAQVRLVVTECGMPLPNDGDPGSRMYKWSYWVPQPYHTSPYPRME